jgi:hypothetical protein
MGICASVDQIRRPRRCYTSSSWILVVQVPTAAVMLGVYDKIKEASDA